MLEIWEWMEISLLVHQVFLIGVAQIAPQLHPHHLQLARLLVIVDLLVKAKLLLEVHRKVSHILYPTRRLPPDQLVPLALKQLHQFQVNQVQIVDLQQQVLPQNGVILQVSLQEKLPVAHLRKSDLSQEVLLEQVVNLNHCL